MSSVGSPVRVDRVVAVVATLRDGQEQLGSGYLVSGRLVLTVEHCTRAKRTGAAAARLRVVRASDGAVAEVADVMSDCGLDVAVLRLADDPPWDPDLPSLVFARVDQSHSGGLVLLSKSLPIMLCNVWGSETRASGGGPSGCGTEFQVGACGWAGEPERPPDRRAARWCGRA